MIILDIFGAIIGGVVFYQVIKALDQRADRLEREMLEK